MSRLSVLPLVALCLVASVLLLGRAGDSTGTPRASADDTENKSKPAETQAPARRTLASREEIPALAPDLMAVERIRRAADLKIRKGLQTRVSVEFKNEPLDSALHKLAKLADVPLWLDMVAMKEEGIELSEPVNAEFTDLTVRQILYLVGDQFALTWLIEDETLKITTFLIAEEILFTRTFDVQRLLEIGDKYDADRLGERSKYSSWTGNSGLGQFDGNGFFDGRGYFAVGDHIVPKRATTILAQFDGRDSGIGFGFEDQWLATQPRKRGEWLKDVLRYHTGGNWDFGRRSDDSLNLVGDFLIVRNTYAVMADVEGLLKALLQVAEGRVPQSAFVVHEIGYPHADDARIHKSLTQKIDVQYEKRPLNEVIADLARRLKITSWLDVAALREEEIAIDTPISFQANDVSANSALRLILKPLRLTAVARDGVMHVTTQLIAEEYMDTVFYDVADLAAVGFGENELFEIIVSCVEGAWPGDEGSTGELSSPLPTVLAVRNPQRQQAEVAQLLANLRTRIAGLKKKPVKPKDNPDELVTWVYKSPSKDSVDDLLKAIPLIVEPETWGGGKDQGTILKVGGSLVIRHTRKVHEEVESFLWAVERSVPEPSLQNEKNSEDKE